MVEARELLNTPPGPPPRCLAHHTYPLNITLSRMASVAENNNAAPQRGENSDQGNAANSIPTTKDEVKEVHVDGLVVLQIIQHIESTPPALGKGCLLGLGENNILEVTHSFGTPLEPQSLDEKKEAHENGDLFGEDYERK